MTDKLKFNNYPLWISGTLALSLGSVVLLGWIFNISRLTRINPDWNPMVPNTALCFILGGLSLLIRKKYPGRTHSIELNIVIGLIMLLAGARIGELVLGHEFGIEFLSPLLGLQLESVGHMSPITASGFLVFGAGMLAISRENSQKLRIVAGVMAGALLLAGLFGIVGYWLNFQFIFEAIYIKTGLIWMAFHTAFGMILLGLGLLCLVMRCKITSESNWVNQQATTIYRTTILVLAVTAVTTGLAGISFLDQTLYRQNSTDLQHSLDAIRLHIVTVIDNGTQRALLPGFNPVLQAEVSGLLRNPKENSRATQRSQYVNELLAYGFSGIAVYNGKQHRLIAGHLLADTIYSARLNGDTDASLAWKNKYYLRVRIPLSGASGSVLVLEQTLPQIDRILENSDHWGKTSALPMCARLDQNRLLCFPQREQAGFYIVPDTYQGKPGPMTLALSGKSGVEILSDYRGHRVLAAYAPVADTGLGLVLRKDMSEIYAPIRDELLIAFPLIIILVALGLWLIRNRVRPLIINLAATYVAEKASRERFDAAMQSSPDGFVIYESMKNQDGDIIDFRCAYLNYQAEIIKGFTGNYMAERVGKSYLEIFPDRADLFDKFKSVVLTGKLVVDEITLVNRDGGTLWFLRQAVPMAHGLAITYRNITKEVLLVQQLEYLNRLRSAIVESAAYSIISTDVNGTILSFNKAAENMLGYRADELIGKATPGVFHDTEEIGKRAVSLSDELGFTVEPGFEVFVAKARVNSVEEREWTYVRKDGSRFPVLLSVTALFDENNMINGFLGIAYDISERKRNEEYIRHIALHDVLTGLPNRELLNDRVKLAIDQYHRSGTVFALAMMDIDRFKHINDSMGHHVGDLILKVYAERVQHCLRTTDTLARMGGDEFVLLLPESDATSVTILMERIFQEFMPAINVGEQDVHITSSIGISIYPRDGNNMQELLRSADLAMYSVKKSGRNGYRLYSPEMDTKAHPD